MIQYWYYYNILRFERNVIVWTFKINIFEMECYAALLRMKLHVSIDHGGVRKMIKIQSAG